MEYTSALEALEGFSNALARHWTHEVVAWGILHALVKVRESQNLPMVMKRVPASL